MNLEINITVAKQILINFLFQLTFKAGNAVPDSGKHYFVVYYINAPDEKIAPRVCWSEHKKEPAGSKRFTQSITSFL